MTRRTVLLVSTTHTYLPGDIVAPTPADAFTGGLTGLLARIGASMRGEGVLLLDARAARRVGLSPTAAWYDDEADLDDHQALTDARNAGWRVSRLRPWTTFYADDRASIHVGILSAIEVTRCPLICPWPSDTVNAFDRWHTLTGSSYHGTPGVAGITMMRALADAGSNPDKTRREPTWRPKGGPPEGPGFEDDYEVRHFKRKPDKGHRVAHGYDAHMAYLGAAMATPLTPWDLKHTVKYKFDRTRSGWFKVEIAPWQHPELPDPAGYSDTPQGRPRWVTGPTLTLLDQLVEEGEHGGYEVLDSWTGPIISASNGRPLRPWGERIRDTIGTLPPVKELPTYDDLGRTDRGAVYMGLKFAYREAIGMLNSPHGLIRRPDWHFAIVAQARSNFFRRIRTVADETRKLTGTPRYPIRIDVDNIWYSAATDDPRAECPAGITLIKDDEPGKLGQFKPKGSKGRRTDNGD